MSKQQIGVVGMAVMGRNLALNIESRGYSVSIFNRTTSKTDEVIALHPDKKLVPTYSVEEFVESLEKPRRILLMVKAGEATDNTIQSLLPHLDKGDILIDGGNTFFRDTMRRNEELANSGINFIGTGVSGGEEGALKGPSIMPGGQKDAYDLVAPILEEILFRFTLFKCTKNKYIFLLTSSILFSLFHVTNLQSIVQIFFLCSYLILSFTLSYILYKSKNICNSILVHSIHNLFMALLLSLGG